MHLAKLPTVKTALIEGKTVVYDFCGSTKDSYSDISIKLNYLGVGVIDKIDNVEQVGEKEYHFFRKPESI